MSASNLINKHCVPCEEGGNPLSEKEENRLHKQVSSWIILRFETHKIRRQFTFDSFVSAIAFVNKIADIAQKQQHHPDIYIFYNKVQIDLFTHAVGGLSENDFIMAAKIDSVFKEKEK